KLNEQVKINEYLKDEILEFKDQINKTEQKELVNNIVIYGIPSEKKENLKVKVKKSEKDSSEYCEHRIQD
ncbi:hypothetical protein HHI36_024095, partial [Cryptolaemus montrouzieri]